MAKEIKENNQKIIWTMLIITVVLAVIVILLFLQRDMGYNNLNCEQLMTESNLIAESENYCNVDSECIIETEVIMHLCGCYELVNKNTNISTLLEKGLKIGKLYLEKSCPVENCALCEVPNQDKVKCIDRRCVVQ